MFVEKMKKLLPKTENPYIKILATEVKRYRQRHIAELYTRTPVIVTVENRYWTTEDDIIMLLERMHVNLLKKYKTYFGESIHPQQNFIEKVKILNKKPIAYRYKKTTLIGNKFKIAVHDDEISQKLAFIAMGAGLLEKNSSMGMGFCIGG